MPDSSIRKGDGAAGPGASALALAIPPLVFAALAIVMLAGSLFGWLPLWPDQQLNLAEMTALRDRPGMLLRLQAGDSPNIAYDVREGLIRSIPVRLTPLEAAITTREDYLFEFLVAHGARADGDRRAGLVCFAREANAVAIAASLAEPGVEYECANVAVPWRND
jgi:hypothetical protein